MDMNLDLKDIVAKLKGGNKKDARGSSGITKFFEKNPKMKIIIPVIIFVIAVVIAGAIIYTSIQVDTSVPPQAEVNAQTVEVLPQVERTSAPIEEGVDPFAEDVIANAKLTGIMYNSNGYRTAIVETEYASYPTLQVGDYVGSSSWLVEEITDSSITFSLGDKTRTIEMK